MEERFCRYNITGLAEEMGVDLETISALYSEYFTEMKGNLQECRILSKEYEWGRLERVIHNMKGISVSLNIEDVHSAAAAFDVQLKNGIFDDAVQAIEQIDLLFNAAERDIKAAFIKNNIQI